MSKLKGVNNAWLAPSGRIVYKHPKFFHEKSWHCEMAECILADMWGMDETLDAYERASSNNNTCTEELEKRGWIRLHGFGGITPVWILPIRQKATKRQEATILDWCLANSRNFESCFTN